MWLLRTEVLQTLERQLAAGNAPTAAQQVEHEAAVRQEREALGAPRNMRIAGSVAEIRVEGVLTPKPDLFARWFGGGNTTYEEIQAALSMAASDPNVKKVVLHVDSPGGHLNGLFDTFRAFDAFEKPIEVRAAYACSAAYGIAAKAGKIEATNGAVEVGSVGVAVTYLHFEELIDITSTEAPNKRPDPSTEEGKAVIKAELDALHDLFVDEIAEGRSRHGAERITAKEVNENYGRGGVLVAKEAKKRGMIDRVASKTLRAVNVGVVPATEPDATAGLGGAKPKDKKPMNAEELKAQHPETYNAVLQLGIDQGVEKGVKQERERVTAHLIQGESSGDTQLAQQAIESGDPMTEVYRAKYDAAARKRRDLNAADDDDTAAAAVVDGATTATNPKDKDLGDIVADRLESLRGGKAVA